ncbi:hypothetical protein K505DRAFT_229341 [Melanomma pulvis-pyrius CBS 109.77]|uniref:PSP1 C-terminal domain-containing protein n=1 Tax=Melanomma pulvis-pyrius CBS 109.77 TaxID=1314802 RepID=A0A6A6XUJ8_9PLEO|nr:hypothetical protein K505DRAFT_229341 [Melanomma pulvis-pyrius CBS 109.77]
MSSTSYKGGLSASGPLFDKSKLQMRRPTPDSDVLASSDDDHDHVPARLAPTNPYPVGRRASQGWMHDIRPNRKFSLPSGTLAGSQPTTPSLEQPPQPPQQPRAAAPSFGWNTSSFSSTPSGTRLQEMLPSPTTSAHPTGEKLLQSPTTVEADDGIGFLLNQQGPIRKQVRSQSYSIGQQDIENSPVGQFSARVRSSVRHRPSKPSLLGDSAVGLSQLREDDVDEVESSNGSEQGVRLPPGYWEREQKQALLKQAAEQNARTRHRTASSGSPVNQHRRKTTQGLRNMSKPDSDYAIEELDDSETQIDGPKLSLTRRFSEHVAAREPEIDHQMPQWATGNILQADNLGRRHSFATVGSHQAAFPLSTLEDTYEVDETLTSPIMPQPEPFDASAYFAGYGPASRAINASAISAAHPDPHTATNHSNQNPYTVPAILGRPGRRLFIVAFKCSRADIYYLYDNTGLEIRRGDLVIVEGDRGCDLGQVTYADISLEDAKKYKTEASEEHFRWLVMFSQYSLAGSSNDSSMLGALAKANGFPNVNRATLTGMGGTLEIETKPKMIKRLAQQHEISALRDKEGSEAKAKRLGAQKAAEHKLPMEILDAEYQADYHKLTYFYYADQYVNFNDLVTDLFKQYKVRIWMSAVNPASVVNPAGLQVPPPSAIGPGAIIRSKAPNASLPVGPGFGSYRPNEQYARATPNATSYGAYDDGYHPFANQLPGFTSQPAYGQPQYGLTQQYAGNTQQYAGNTQQYGGRYGSYPVANAGYPNATGGSPMNYGGYFPPTTYSSSPAFNNAASGSPYRSGYPATSPVPAPSYATGYSGTTTAAPPYASTTGQSYGAQTTGTPSAGNSQGATSGAGGWGVSGAPGNGYTATSSGNYDQSFLSAMQKLSFGK